MLKIHRPLRVAGGLALVIFLVVGGWFYTSTYPLGGKGSRVKIEVSSGESVSQLASILVQRKVISSTLAFRIDCAIFGTPTLSPGTFFIAQNSPFSTVKSIFGSPSKTVVLTVEPGLTLHEVALTLASDVGPTFASDFVSAASSAAASSPFHPNSSLEGLIGSGTYLISPGESAQHLIRTMTRRFIEQATSAGLTTNYRHHGLTPYQLVIAASIVQKEGYYDENMGKVARVILNRLASGTGLQMDSTILYALGRDGGTVTPAMLQSHSPYNTYLHAGLTPTPICVPSVFALKSIVKPPKGHWLYFTLINRDGQMAFSSTFAQQLVNERKAAAKGIK